MRQRLLPVQQSVSVSGTLEWGGHAMPVSADQPTRGLVARRMTGWVALVMQALAVLVTPA